MGLLPAAGSKKMKKENEEIRVQAAPSGSCLSKTTQENISNTGGTCRNGYWFESSK